MTKRVAPGAVAALDALGSVLTPRSAALACGPLEHGLAFYEARARGAAGDDVRPRNEAGLSAFAEGLRGRLSRPVIDPGLLRVDGWNPDAYDAFFLEVIRRFVGQAWFVDGWEYSDGATKEFILCTELGLERLDERGAGLEVPSASRLLDAAIDHLAWLGVDHARLRSRRVTLAALDDAR